MGQHTPRFLVAQAARRNRWTATLVTAVLLTICAAGGLPTQVTEAQVTVAQQAATPSAADAAITWRLETIVGEQYRGSALTISDTSLQLSPADGGPVTIAVENLLLVERVQDAPAAAPLVAAVGLVNGSRIAIDTVSSDGKTATLLRGGQTPVTIPLSLLRWVRYRPPTAAVDAQWLGLVEQARSADSLVVRRPGDVIDEVAGAVVSLNDQTVAFNMDGDTLQAPLARLEGIVFASLASAASDSSGVSIEMLDGSRWIGRSLSGVSGDGSADNVALVGLTLNDEVQLSLPWASIRRIELTGSTQYLAALQPAASEYQPRLSIGLSDELAAKWFGPQVVGGTHDWQMQANSFVEYHVPDGVSRLTGSVDFSPEVEQGGLCVVRILVDDQSVWEQTLDVADATPRGFELPLQQARRVRLVVDSGGDGHLGDRVRFRQPRFVK